MTMPEAAMDQDDSVPFRQDKIRLTREILGVEAKAKSS
jgi:hypothetical protein